MESGFRVGKDCFDDSRSLVMISGQGETELRCRNHGGKWQRTSFAEKKKTETVCIRDGVAYMLRDILWHKWRYLGSGGI